AAGRRQDRLSALSDDLLHKIITQHLPVTEAAQTAALARRWRNLWSSTPLVLRDADLPEPARDAVVPRVLAEHPGHFRTVVLHDCRLASLDRELPGWPLVLAAKDTQKLDLLPNQVDPFPCIPEGILRCGTLKELSLGYWDLSRGANISLPHLRSLTLIMVVISDQDLEHLVAACPALKTLHLSSTGPAHVRLRSPSLHCALVGLWMVEDFAVVDAPLLERLILFLPPRDDGVVVRVKIGGHAANLRVLGHLNTRAHRLQIGDIVIQRNTMASTSAVIPSVKILAVAVNFDVLSEVRTLASFLRCFPNVDTLHIESAVHGFSIVANEPCGEIHARFWEEVSLVECLRSHVRKMVIHKFRGDQNEFRFLKFVAMNAKELQSLHVVLQQENTSSTDKMNETEDNLQSLWFRTGISGVLLVRPTVGFTSILQKATDLTSDDPFRF
ncbi:putative FBD-associated F-box protein At5g22720, partial [Lolium rigidum]|uniref:putative FBD-associated F-box protein At5g22720 n=1 Tax=Lolium rigidum TaxID=89674 RepID=UPI001F5DC3E1